ncbi:hypothetical protein GCM10009618_11650 [Nesterenkonia lacusekhoensis]
MFRMNRIVAVTMLAILGATGCGGEESSEEPEMNEEEFTSVVDEMAESLPGLLRAAHSADFDLTGHIQETTCTEGVSPDEEPGDRTRLSARFVSQASSAEEAEEILVQLETSWPEMGWKSGDREDRSQVQSSNEVTRVTFQRNWGNSQDYGAQAVVTHEENHDGEHEVVVAVVGSCVSHEGSGRNVDSYPLNAEEG